MKTSRFCGLAVCLCIAIAEAQEPTYQFEGFRITLPETYRTPITATAFRGVFTLEQLPTRAFLIIEVDDQYNVYVNGAIVGSIKTFTDGKACAYEIADLLRKGVNVVAVEAYSALDRMHFGLDVRAESFDGVVLLRSDDSLKARLCPAPPDLSWTKPNFDDADWPQAQMVQEEGQLQGQAVMPLVRAPRSTEAFPFPPEAYLPSLIPADYPFRGEWIQPVPPPEPGAQGAVWASFTCPKGKYERVLAFITGDDRYMLYINGKQLGWDWSPVSWNCGEVFDITDDVIDGPNFITVRLRNDLVPFCASLCEVWGINGGDSFVGTAQRDLLLASSGDWDSMWGNLYEMRAEVRKAKVLGTPPCEPWFTIKAIPCRLMPTADSQLADR